MTHIPPVDHALKALRLQADRGQRMADAALGAARLLTEDPASPTWQELWDIWGAALERYDQLQRGWIEDWCEWARYAARIEGVATLSKLNERELNIVNQAFQLASEQQTALLGMFENVEINVLYWINARSMAARAPA